MPSKGVASYRVDAAHSMPLSLSMPSAELELLERRVAELKERGRTKRLPSRTKLVRLALARLFQESNDAIEQELERWKL